jgi:hypothetical protein
MYVMKYLLTIKKFSVINPLEKKLLVKGIVLSLLMKLIVQLLPLKYYIFIMKARPGFCIAQNEKSAVFLSVKRTMRRIIRYIPWHCSCLVKSMTFKVLLNSVGIENDIHFTLTKLNPKLLKAHAFVQITRQKDFLTDSNLKAFTFL